MNDEQRLSLSQAVAVESADGAPSGSPEPQPAVWTGQLVFAPPPDTEPAIAACRDGLGDDELLAVLATLFPEPEATRHWLAGVARCGAVATGLPASLAGWDEGRVWAAHAEVRWTRQTDGQHRALYLAEGTEVPPGWQPLAYALRSRPGAPLALWGRQGADGSHYTRGRAAPLEYAGLPVRDGIAWVGCRYLLDAAGVVRFIRLAQERES
ncbi:MAG: hypothetical protein IRZ14_04725 [Chloroflexi bacterium]|nr:hypothetical protein [Chloroflexota bacterium]